MAVLYLFDIDGTLLHARSGRAAFDAVLVECFGVPEASTGIAFGGKTDPLIVDEIFAARFGRPASDGERAAVFEAYLPRLRAMLAVQGVEVIAGVGEALAHLATCDVVLGVATGNIRAGADTKLAAAGLADRCSAATAATRACAPS